MKTLKLQMQVTIDGFVARPDGTQDWMIANRDPDILNLVDEMTEASDTILMGRKLSADFMKYWEDVVDGKIKEQFPFAKKMVDLPKIIFSKTQKTTIGHNARMENGDMRTEVLKLKQGSGKDIVVYGGASFASSLIEADLVDDYHLFINPTAIGDGMRIFKDTVKLKLIDSTSFKSGVVKNHYRRA
jgi:dihydrofolate reductase